MKKPLSQYFSLNRRYSRSINLERDLEKIEALTGYILTERSVDALRRILAGLTSEQSPHAWTLTSVYGTGKSAFAHFLASLCAPQASQIRCKALEIASAVGAALGSEYSALNESIPSQGLFRAVATAQREPLSNTIVRALERGSELFWSPSERSKLDVARKLVDLSGLVATQQTVNSQEIPKLVQEVVEATSTGILLIIDELGKNLEYAVQNQGAEDLYLLQQLAELTKTSGKQVYIVGLLHASFADYGERLASVQRNEWAKIQGRFEDIPFRDSPTQMIRLIGQAIDQSQAETFHCAIYNQAEEWFEHLPSDITDDVTSQMLAAAYPLHPISALVLPMLCTRYAQNDRSLFTFLTSAEPYSFKNFLEETTVVAGDSLPTLKLEQVYDYFIEAVGMGLASRPNLQRWVEIQDLITDAKRLDADSLRVLKTIGILNLVTTTGALRATRALVTLAMCSHASDSNKSHWEQVIESLCSKGIITHRRQLDELRIWQGSDFNVDVELTDYVEKERSPLVSLLPAIRPLTPIVAQRHSYKTGTLRYFERRYLDGLEDLTKVRCSLHDCDGLVGYWVDELIPRNVPSFTADGKPLIVLCAAQLDLLRIRAKEFAALKKIITSAPELQTDGVARREVRYRLVQAEQFLDETLSYAFDMAANQSRCWIHSKQEIIQHVTDFNAKLSDVCDEVYNQGLVLWNELINRRELTSQGAKARRELIEAMLEHPEQERLSFQGYGPSVSMYFSVLGETGLHRAVEGDWGFYPPLEKSGVLSIWQAIDDFCISASEKQQTLDNLYKHLEAPPYGVKRGVISVLLAAVLLYHVDDVGVYKEGTFVPVLGAEHFELLVKDPSRFSIKYFEVVGLRSQVFKELEAILRNSSSQMPLGVRNVTLLTVVRPLFQFVKKLPAYTKKTKHLSVEALSVLQALQQAPEPDELLFTALPKACGLTPIGTDEGDDSTTAKTLRRKLVSALREIQTAYDELLSKCQSLLYDAFGVRSSETKLREDLRVRSNHLIGQCIERTLKRFTIAAVDETAPDKEWLEALLMIVADKPAESWTDEEITGFEVKLSDLARRFKNLEALQKEVAAKGEGFEARRITITRPDGQEVNQVVWVDHDLQKLINDLVDEILANPVVRDNAQRRLTLVAKLTEKVLGSASRRMLLRFRRSVKIEGRSQQSAKLNFY